MIRFKQYLPSIIQSVEFTGRVTRQNNGLYVLRMIVKLAYYLFVLLFIFPLGNTSHERHSRRKAREAYLIHKGKTLSPIELNRRNERY